MQVDTVKTPKPLVVEDKTALISDLLSDYKEPVAHVPNEPIRTGTSNPTQTDNTPGISPTGIQSGSTPDSQTHQIPLPQGVEYYKSGKKAGQPKPPKKVRVGYTPTIEMSQINSNLLSGALFLTLVDLVLPMLVAALNNRFSKIKVKASELMMTAKQKNELAPIADKVMSQVNITANPTLLLCISMFAIYGMNLAALQLTKSVTNNEKTSDGATQKQGGQTGAFDPNQYVQRKAA